MPRKRREISQSGIYHVVIRAIDRQLLFEETKDYKKFLDIIINVAEEIYFEIYAYCLMSNHVHLIIRCEECSISDIFRHVNTQYAVWFNLKYRRTGHLMQDRFHSEPIENSQYLLKAIRYVHQNPYKAGLEKLPGDSYKWSSFNEFFKKKTKIITTDFVYNFTTKKDFYDFNLIGNDEKFLDIRESRQKMLDEVAREKILELSGCKTCTDFQNLSIKKRNEYIIMFYEAGMSIRQINRLTGIPRGIIERKVKETFYPEERNKNGNK